MWTLVWGEGRRGAVRKESEREARRESPGGGGRGETGRDWGREGGGSRRGGGKRMGVRRRENGRKVFGVFENVKFQKSLFKIKNSWLTQEHWCNSLMKDQSIINLRRSVLHRYSHGSKFVRAGLCIVIDQYIIYRGSSVQFGQRICTADTLVCMDI